MPVETHNTCMRISARADYAIRAVVELVARGSSGPVKAEQLAQGQGLPVKFLLNILVDLKRAGILRSHRGAEGGFLLGRSPEEITIADVIRAADGPLARVGHQQPEEVIYPGHAAALREVWVAVRVSLRDVLEEVTVADVCSGQLPARVRRLLDRPDAWFTKAPPKPRVASREPPHRSG
jgi:Rrf2 family protein